MQPINRHHVPSLSFLMAFCMLNRVQTPTLQSDWIALDLPAVAVWPSCPDLRIRLPWPRGTGHVLPYGPHDQRPGARCMRLPRWHRHDALQDGIPARGAGGRRVGGPWPLIGICSGLCHFELEGGLVCYCYPISL